MELNGKVIEALQLYHNLMKELPGYGYSTVPKPGQPLPPMAPGQQQVKLLIEIIVTNQTSLHNSWYN